MIIDAHVHIGKTEKTKRYFTLESYYGLMEQNGIEKSIVMPNLSNIIDTSILNEQLINEYISSNLEEKFWPLIVIDPKDLRTLEQIYLYKNIIYGVKYHPSISETTLDGPKMHDFLVAVSELDFSMLVHCGRHWRSNIKYLINAAKKFKTVDFIAAHLGGNATDIIEKALDLLSIEKINNIYLDTSAGKLPWLIEKAIEDIGPDKIIFGSDEPYADLRVAKYCMDLCDIADGDKKKLCYYNAARLYRKKVRNDDEK